jgi:DNA modification methylase
MLKAIAELRPSAPQPLAEPAPIGLISKLVGAVTKSGDFVVDPVAGGHNVLSAAQAVGRRFLGCDIEIFADTQ